MLGAAPPSLRPRPRLAKSRGCSSAQGFQEKDTYIRIFLSFFLSFFFFFFLFFLFPVTFGYIYIELLYNSEHNNITERF